MTNEIFDTGAVLDSAHVGDIRGAFGTIAHGDTAARPRLSASSRPYWPSSGLA